MKFLDNVGDLSYFPGPWPIVYVMFLSEDIRRQVSKSSKPNKCKSFLAPFFPFLGDDANCSTADC